MSVSGVASGSHNRKDDPTKDARTDGYRRPTREYGTYRPLPRNKGLYTAICMKGESGEFRVACHGSEPFRISLDKKMIFGDDYFPNYEFEMVFPIDELRFKDNTFVTPWYSFKDRILSRRMVIKHSDPSHSLAKSFEEVCGIFERQKIDASFRFEITVAKDKTLGFEIFGRSLPCGADRLNDDSRLSSGDVGATTFFSIHSNTFVFPATLADIKDVIPTSPVMFTDSVITMDQYRTMVVETFPAIMMKLWLLKDLDFLSACSYIKDTKAKSGNERRYSHVPSILTKKNPQPALDKTSDLELSPSELQISLSSAKDDINNENAHNVKLAKTAQTMSISDAKKAKNQTEPTPPGVDNEEPMQEKLQSSFPQFEDCFPTSSPPPPPQPHQQAYPGYTDQYVQHHPGHPQPPNYPSGFTPPPPPGYAPPPGFNKDMPHHFYPPQFGYPYNNMWQSMQRPPIVQGHGLDDAELKEKFPSLYNSSYFDTPATEYLTLQFLAKEELTEKNKFFNNPKTVEDKLVANEAKVLVDTTYPECVDNLQSKLHPIRYSRFPVIPTTELFKQIADKIDPILIPISCYDLTHTINSHQISPTAWVEGHNLFSQKFSLKMLTESNSFKISQGQVKFKIVERSGDPEVQSEAVLDDIKNMTEFRRAFFWCGVLRKRVLPIDCSLESLEIFLIDKEYFYSPCNADGYGRGKMHQGAFCALFSDYIIRVNNTHLRKREKHLTAEDIHAKFISFCNGDARFKNHSQSLLLQENKARQPQQQPQQRPSQQQQRNQQKPQRQQNQRQHSSANEFCKFFNEGGTCWRSKLEDGNCRDRGNIVRFHLCWHQQPNGSFCSAPHKAIDHK